MTPEVFLKLEAIDTLMFRDGRPFNRFEAGASAATSIFPPLPPAVVGAIRAALWQDAGGHWDKDKLGDGTDWNSKASLNEKLEFSAPLLRKNGRPMFPAPLHLVSGKKGEKKVFELLRPMKEPLETDIGPVRLPQTEDPDLKGIKPEEESWLTVDGMNKILAGKPLTTEDAKHCRINKNNLWQMETRVGIGIDSGSRSVAKGQLYTASHVRLAEDVDLVVSVKSESQFANLNLGLNAFAGRHRMAHIEPLGSRPDLPKTNTLPNRRYCAILISPMIVDEEPQLNRSIKKLPGKLVSACLGKPQPLGGWNSQNKKPLPLRLAIPAGSVWFFEGDDGTALSKNLSKIGCATDWGFGQILIGAW